MKSIPHNCKTCDSICTCQSSIRYWNETDVCPAWHRSKVNTEDANEKPPIGVPPWYVIYPARIRALTAAIDRHADKADEHCVYEWLQEIYILRHVMHAMKTKEFYEEELKRDRP